MSDKYFRTYHLPFSLSVTSDDKRLDNCDLLLNKRVILTRKMDGSNVCLEHNALFARSHSGMPSHPSFDLLKAKWAAIKVNIPNEYSLFGEWLFAVHSIKYSNFSNRLYKFPFMLFGIRDNVKNEWMSWDDVVLISHCLSMDTVPVLHDGFFTDETNLRDIVHSVHSTPDSFYSGENEGVVVRLADCFSVSESNMSVAKFVRKDHINTSDDHWSNQTIVRNGGTESDLKILILC